MPRSVPEWKEYFLAIAATVAIRSKDPKKQVGCVIVNQVSKTIVSGGYNGMVFGVDETNAWENKEMTWLCHAEMNAIALAARNGSSTENCHAYVTRFPCLPCARILIQAGIKAVHTPVHTRGADNQSEFERVIKLFKMANIQHEAGKVSFTCKHCPHPVHVGKCQESAPNAQFSCSCHG